MESMERKGRPAPEDLAALLWLLGSALLQEAEKPDLAAPAT